MQRRQPRALKPCLKRLAILGVARRRDERLRYQKIVRERVGPSIDAEVEVHEEVARVLLPSALEGRSGTSEGLTRGCHVKRLAKSESAGAAFAVVEN